MRFWWLGALAAGALAVVLLAQPQAEPVKADDAVVVAAARVLGGAIRQGDKSAARKLLSLQFSYVDETGRVVPRKEFLGDLKAAGATPVGEAALATYGLLAMLTGHRKSARGGEVFFLDIWAKQKGAWRALLMQDLVPGSADTPPAPPLAEARPCKNPCEAVPYRTRSPAEQDIVAAFRAIEQAVVAHDAEAWSKRIAGEFAIYRSGRAPVSRAERIAAIKRQQRTGAAIAIGEVQTMRLFVFGDAAAMTASHVMPDNSRPPYRAARVWVKRAGQWQMAISAQTEVK
jgi:hypothetical protein